MLILTACDGGGGGAAPADTTSPVITLNDTNPVTLVQSDTYVETGATATDYIDGSVSVNISGIVDTNTLGSYTIDYKDRLFQE